MFYHLSLKITFNLKQRICFPLLLVAVFIALSQSGCKENVMIDSAISPADNAIGVYDTTLSIITHTYNDDTALTSYSDNATGALKQAVGSMEDPFFGTMNGATFMQLLPGDVTPVIYDGKTIDSAVMVLPYSGFKYGDTADQTKIGYQVFFMTEGISRGTNYYSHSNKEIDLVNPLSDPYEVNMHNIGDSVNVAGKNYNPGLRIRLKLPTLLNRLMPALSGALGTNDPNGNFLNAFKGVCVRVADNRKVAGSMPYFNLDGGSNYTGAGILVYYHTNGGNDTLVYRYAFNSASCAFFNNISRSYGHHPVNNLYTSTAANDSLIGVQNTPGANLDIVIPGIKSLPKGVISKAEIRLSVLPWRKDTKYSPVDRLFPLRVNNGIYPAGFAAGTTVPVYDWFSGIQPFSVINGTLNTINNSGTTTETYTVNIPREIMTSIKAGNDTLHLHLLGSAIYSGAYRSILGGGSHPSPVYRAKLFVVYSALNK